MKVPEGAVFETKVGKRTFFSMQSPVLDSGHLVIQKGPGLFLYVPVAGKAFTVKALQEPQAFARGSVVAPRTVDEVMAQISDAGGVVDPDFERAREIQRFNRIRNKNLEGVW